MGAGVTRRRTLAAAVGMLLSAPLLTVGLPGTALRPTPALAAGPDAVQVTGADLTEPLTIRPAGDAELFTAVLGQVNWLATRTSETKAPASDTLGPKYTVVVLQKGQAKQTYDLYPLATGGPKVFRPAKQPDKRKVTAAWFNGRLSMPDVLREAGAPLPELAGFRSGGSGGGDSTGEALDPPTELANVLGEWRQVLVLNGVVVLMIMFGLAGMAYVIRRRV